jgi:hypothetical protein
MAIVIVEAVTLRCRGTVSNRTQWWHRQSSWRVGDRPAATRHLPAVSPNGREVFYALFLDSRLKGVQAQDLASGAVRMVFEGPLINFALSPDGQSVAIASPNRRSAADQTPPFRIVPVAGGAARAIGTELSPIFHDFGFAWSLDGRYLYFPRLIPKKGMAIWRIPVDGAWRIPPTFSPRNASFDQRQSRRAWAITTQTATPSTSSWKTVRGQQRKNHLGQFAFQNSCAGGRTVARLYEPSAVTGALVASKVGCPATGPAPDEFLNARLAVCARIVRLTNTRHKPHIASYAAPRTGGVKRNVLSCAQWHSRPLARRRADVVLATCPSRWPLRNSRFRPDS